MTISFCIRGMMLSYSSAVRHCIVRALNTSSIKNVEVRSPVVLIHTSTCLTLARWYSFWKCILLRIGTHKAFLARAANTDSRYRMGAYYYHREMRLQCSWFIAALWMLLIGSFRCSNTFISKHGRREEQAKIASNLRLQSERGYLQRKRQQTPFCTIYRF